MQRDHSAPFQPSPLASRDNDASALSEPQLGDRSDLQAVRVDRIPADSIWDRSEQRVAIIHSQVGKDRQHIVLGALPRGADDRGSADRYRPPLISRRPP